ncbi:MAG TPA: MerR family transcriptional regulator [Candidatus Fournierella merdigallinarum]|nr:MerR family transcriptional regulator [Candidatus Fournierella merdigallinarum]
MRIKEVEARVDLSARNIRFYEKQGLLAPRRQAGNGYRDYDEADLDALRRVKLLRKLDVPLEEIRAMLAGELSLDEGLRRHLVTLEARSKNLDTARRLCAELANTPGLLAALDPAAALAEMDRLEQKGVRFIDVRKTDQKKKTHAAWLAALVFVGLMVMVEWMMVWALTVDPVPLPVALLLAGWPPVLVAGTLLALRQRLKEIRKGEEDAYRNY